MHVHLAPHDERAVRRGLLREWRRRRARIGQVLVTMPGTGDTSVDDFSFPERPVLVLTQIGDGGNLAAVPEDGDSLPGARHHARTLLRNLLNFANSNV